MRRSRATPKAGSVKKKSEPPSASKRAYLKQSDVPNASLDEAMRIPSALFEHYAGKPTSPMQVAKALNVDPIGSQLKVLSGAAIAFGLIEGGTQAANMSVTPLATRILRPTAEGEEIQARREAVLKPRIFREFLERYKNNPFPRPDIAINVLEEMGVPRLKAAEVLERLESSARAVGFIEEIKGKVYVTLDGVSSAAPSEEAETKTSDTTSLAGDDAADTSSELRGAQALPPPLPQRNPTTLSAAVADDARPCGRI